MVAALLVVLEPVAEAPSPGAKVALGPVELVGSGDGSITEIDAASLRGALSIGLRRGELEIELLDGDCELRACWIGAATASEIAGVLFATVERRGPDHHLRLEVVASKSGAVVASLEGRCELCGRDELLETASDLAATLSPRLSRLVEAPASLALRGAPAGAIVHLDGDRVGTLPWTGELPPGEHRVVVTLDGYTSQERIFEATSGVSEHLEFTLETSALALPTTGPATAGLATEGMSTTDPSGGADTQARLRTERARFTAGGVIAAGGLVGVGVGVALFIYDGRPHGPSCESQGIDENGHCAMRYEATTPAITSAVIGGAVLVAGAVLIVHTLSRRERGSAGARVQVRPTPGGIALAF